MKRLLIKIITVVVVLLLGYISFHHWRSCWRFVDQFYATSATRQNELLVLTNGEQGVPIFVVRMLFNKVAYLPWSILQTSLQYFDIRFLQRFVSVVGGIGVYLGFWYFLQQYGKNILLWIVTLLLLGLSIFEMLIAPHNTFGSQIFPFFILFEAISLFGIWQFLKGKYLRMRYMILFILLILSVIYLVAFPNAYQTYCLNV